MPINLRRSKVHSGTGFFSLPYLLEKLPILLHNSTEKNKENMKGRDYSQPRNGGYHLRESTRIPSDWFDPKKIISINLHASTLIFNYLPGL